MLKKILFAAGIVVLMMAVSSQAKVDIASVVATIINEAESGNIDAFFLLGLMHEFGRGVRPNNIAAKQYYGKACDKGFQPGCDQYRRLNEAGY